MVELFPEDWRMWSGLNVVYHLHEKTIWLEIVQMEHKNFN